MVGDKTKIEEIAASINLDLSKQTVVDELNVVASARKAVEFVSTKQAKTLMKGMIGTADFLEGCSGQGDRPENRKLLSHVAVIKSPKFDKLFYLTDGAMCCSDASG